MSSCTSLEAPSTELDFILTYFYFSTCFFPAVLSRLYLALVSISVNKYGMIFPSSKLIDVIPCKSRRWSVVANPIYFLSQHLDL